MRICFYTHTALPLIGGQEMAVDALARELTGLGHELVVLAPRPKHVRPLGDENLPYRVERHPRFISKHLVSWYRGWLRRLHKRQSFDVVHAHGIFPAGYIAALCRDYLRCPLVMTSQGEDVGAGRHLKNPSLYARHVQAVEQADALISISPYTCDGFQKLSPGASTKTIEIPNGVNLQDFATPVPRSAGLDAAIRPGEYLLFLGRLAPRKGVHVLLDAMALIPPNVGRQLVIAGDGKERADLESQVSRLGLQNRVRFVGMVRDQTKVYLLQNARCTIVPSIGWEGQPLVVLESFAAGRPVLCSDLPSITGTVKHGENGWIVPQEDASELARALSGILADDAQLSRMSAGASESARAYSWSAIAQRHIQLYQALLDSNRMRKSA